MDSIAQSMAGDLAQEPVATVTSATHKTYLEIRRMILAGELEPGRKLKIEDLKALLGAGASPIREALSLLTSDQLVERIDQRGFRTAPVNETNFDEILRLRCALEDMALRGSIAATTPAWEDRVVLCHHRLSRHPRDGSEAFEAVHKAFHMVLLENCGSPILLRFCHQLYDLNVRYRNLAGRALSYKKRDVNREHADIFDAVIRHDAEAASGHLLNHYRQTGDFLRTAGQALRDAS